MYIITSDLDVNMSRSLVKLFSFSQNYLGSSFYWTVCDKLRCLTMITVNLNDCQNLWGAGSQDELMEH